MVKFNYMLYNIFRCVLQHINKKVIYLPTNNLPTLKSNTMKNLMQK